jgi:hypothetical protein
MAKLIELVALALLIVFPAAAHAAPSMTAGGTPRSGTCGCALSPCVILQQTPAQTFDLTDIAIANIDQSLVSVSLLGGNNSPLATFAPPTSGTFTQSFATPIRFTGAVVASCSVKGAGVVITISGVQR